LIICASMYLAVHTVTNCFPADIVLAFVYFNRNSLSIAKTIDIV
jgi:hypothetical protein